MPRTATQIQADYRDLAEGVALLYGGEKAVSFNQEALAQRFLRGEAIGGSGEMGGPSDPFSQQWTVYRCISVISQSVGRLPIRLSNGPAKGVRQVAGAKRVRYGRHKGRPDAIRNEKDIFGKAAEGSIVEAGPLFDLLERPNEEQTWSEFLSETMGWLLLAGRVHWILDDMVGRRPRKMWIVPGTRTRPITHKEPTGERLDGWKIRDPGGSEHAFTLDETITLALFNPASGFGGLSPIVPAKLAIISDYNAATYNAAMFANSAEPGGILKTAAPYSAELDETLKGTWSQRQQGASKAKRVAVLWGGMEWQSVASTMADMQFIDGRKMSRTEIAATFGVPEVVAGWYTDANYQFAEIGDQIFWLNTVIPHADRIAEVIDVHVAPRFDVRLKAWFDVEDVPVIQRIRNANLDPAGKLFCQGVPMEDLNEMYDLGLPARPWYSVGFLPVGLMSANEVIEGVRLPDEGMGGTPSDQVGNPEDQGQAAGDGEQATGEEGEDAETRGRGDAGNHELRTTNCELSVSERAAADRLWQRWARSWATLAKRGRAVFRAELFAQERRVLKALKEADTGTRGHGDAETGADSPRPRVSASPRQKDPALVARILLEITGSQEAAKRFRARVRAVQADAGELGLRQALAEAGLTAEQINEAVRRILSNPAIIEALGREAIRITTLVDNATRRVLRNSLTEGLNAGESIQQLTTRVQGVMGNRRAAAMTIARNTVGQAISDARDRGQRAAGMTHKVWMHSRGPGERRPGHVAAEQRYMRDPIPMDAYFDINGVALRYPRDPSGPAAEIVNCQCLCLARKLPAGTRSISAAEFVRPLLSLAFVEADAVTRRRGDAEKGTDE